MAFSRLHFYLSPFFTSGVSGINHSHQLSLFPQRLSTYFIILNGNNIFCIWQHAAKEMEGETREESKYWTLVLITGWFCDDECKRNAGFTVRKRCGQK